MAKTISLTINFFGALSKYSSDSAICLTQPHDVALSSVRQALLLHLQKQFPDFSDAELLAISVFANESQVLSETTVFIDNTTIVVLPPVCGG